MVHRLAPLDTVRADGDSFVLRALPADHDRTHGEEPLIFDFAHEGKRLLYACDTGPFPAATWAAVEGVVYDAVVLECTFHLREKCRQGHLDWENFLAVRRRLAGAGCLAPNTLFVAQHLSHGHAGSSVPEDELAKRFADEGVTMARDGMRLEL